MEVIYEDNHIIVVNKAAGKIVQGDRTGDQPLVETLKQWIKEKYDKPGNVFCGVVHRIDRPTWGLVVFARTSKGLSRMNELLRRREMHKTYWAITCAPPPQRRGTLTHWLTSVERNNKTYASPTPVEGAAKAEMNYRLLASGERYHLLEVELITGQVIELNEYTKDADTIRGDGESVRISMNPLQVSLYEKESKEVLSC